MVLKYFSYYMNKDNKQNRTNVLAASNKIDYICEALIGCGYDVHIVSASGTSNKKGIYPGYTVKLKDQKYLQTFPTVPWRNCIQKILQLFFVRTGIFFSLMQVKKREHVLVYHSLGYMNIVKFAHKLKKFHLILEVEEIYADVIGDKKLREKELEFLQSADSYIFPTQLLDEIVNVNKKPVVIIHGTYQVEIDRECKIFSKSMQDTSDKIIHCVYAGTLDPRKGGGAAAAAAEFLPSNYHLHVLGFGSEEDVSKMKDFVSKISRISKAKVTYDGVLSGDDYIKFIQSCDIGLSTQDPTAAFNGTSFPSKILSYLANGLRVVSIKIPAIEQSAVDDMLYYYTKQTPEEIAKAIQSVKFDDDYNSRKRIAELASAFEKDFKKLLESYK